MPEWAATGERICGYGVRGSVTLDVEGWQAGGDPPPHPGSVDAVVAGTADAVGLPDGEATLHGEGVPLAAGEVPDGVHRVVVDSTPETVVVFEGPATVGPEEPAWIRFPEPTAVAFCLRERPPPRPVLSVPTTASGLATAATAAGRTHGTDGPERSHPGFRPPTPWVRFGDRSVPEDLEGPADGPTVTVPDSVQAVLVAAPLAYYLGAELRVEDGPPAVRGDGLVHEFEPLPAFADGVADALRRLVALDSRLRSVPGETGALIDDDRDLASAPPARRLAAVLDDPPASLPAWPLSTYVDDDPTNGRFLPYLLDDLSLVHPAEASVLEPRGLLKRSLDEFFRGETPNVEAVDPALTESRFHAWLGEGTPVDAYALLRPESPDVADAGGLRIDVVCNEPEMASERSVADVYRRRLAGRDVDVHVHERLTTGDLASVFERPTDLVHFVGHCEVGGMVCPDGTLAAADLQECGADAFFLNACGSYYEGYELVRQGATVGAVTLSAVLDEQAVTLGTTFAELLAAGFAFDRALSLARGEIIVGRDYVVVGDGTHRLGVPVGTPGRFRVASADGEYDVAYDATAPDAAGRRYRSPVDGEVYLCGEASTATVDGRGVADLLGGRSAPVLYDGSLHFSEEVAPGFAGSG
jgi:hypothetical protein